MRVALVCAWLLAAPVGPLALSAEALAKAEQPQPPKDFVAVDETLPGEQIPALPLIAGAYGFIWVVLLGYVYSVGKRLQKVEAELADLEARRK
jgi:CcmD family protein